MTLRGPIPALIVSGLVVALLVGLLVWHPQERRETSILMYCAAGMRPPVARIARDYGREYGVRVDIQYGGSGTLLNNLRVARKGDLYLAADNSYIEIGREGDLLAEAIPVANIRPVIAVRKGNPEGIHSVDDLLRPGIKTALGNPTAASVGKWTRVLLTKRNRWEALEQAVRDRGVFKPTVNEVANDVKIRTVHAGIVWDATVRQYPDLEAVALAGSESVVKNITIGVLKSSRQPTAALRFARYLTARDEGLKVFEKMGYPPVEGDKWADVPEIVYYCGGVNRLAIQQTLKEFEQREGVKITTVYNGCGILKGSIIGPRGARPDGYHTCDSSFMAGVEDHFLPATDITETDMVIVCAKGNPEGIKELKDLARKGLKVGLANEKQSALGALTARLLKAEGLYDAVMPNVVSRTPTADLLINQIRTGSLHAVVVYEANTTKVRDKLELIPIQLSQAKAVQSLAIGKGSDHKHLMSRLSDAIHTAESKRRFQQGGFRWLEGGEGK